MIKEIVINAGTHERRIAVLEDGKLEEFLIERPDNERLVGNIYLGTVRNVLPSMHAVFVEIGAEKAGFLSYDDIDFSSVVDPAAEGLEQADRQQSWLKKVEHMLPPGQPILVR